MALCNYATCVESTRSAQRASSSRLQNMWLWRNCATWLDASDLDMHEYRKGRFEMLISMISGKPSFPFDAGQQNGNITDSNRHEFFLSFNTMIVNSVSTCDTTMSPSLISFRLLGTPPPIPTIKPNRSLEM